ncbi:MAG: DUF6541 family protein [Oryzihumus sp.]
MTSLAAWAPAWPALLAAAAVLLVPGLATAYAAGLRGIPAWGLAAPLSVSIAAVGAVLGPFVGMRWGVALALLVTAVSAALAFGLDLLLRRLQGSAPGSDRSPTRLLALVGGAVGAVFASASVMVGLRRPDAVAQTFDAVFHLNAVRYAMTTGDASSLDLGRVSSPQQAHVFYPAAWHAVTALVAEVAGVAPPTAANAVSVATAALVWVSGCVLLARQVLGSRPFLLVAAGVLAPGFAAAPYMLMSYGTVWPNALGTALLPACLAALVSLAGLAREDLLGRRRAALVTVAVMPGLVLAHPNVVVALLAWGMVLAPAAARRLLGDRSVVDDRRARLVWGGVAGYVLVVVWLVIWSPVFAATRGTNWPRRESIPQAAGEWLLSAPCAVPVAAVLAGLVLVGLVTSLRSPVWWLGACHLVTAGLWVLAAGSDAPISQMLTGPWYNDAFRLGALIPVTGVPLAVLGLDWLVDQAGRVRVVPWTHAHRAVLALLAVVLLSQGLSVRDNAHVLSTWYYPSRDVLAGPREQALLRRLDALVPAGSVVAGSPWNGSVLGQALSHRQMLYPHMLGRWGTDGTLLANELVDASGDRAVCTAARRLHVGYVLDGPSGFWVTDPRQRWYAGLHVAGAPGFQPVASGGRLTLYRITACGS